MKVKSLSHIPLFGTPWTVAHQAPLSMRFSRQEYWSGLPFPSPIFQYFNYCLPGFVTAIWDSSFVSHFWIVVLISLNAITHHLEIFIPDQRSSPEPLEWEQ